MKYLSFLNPFEWIRATKFVKQNSKFDKSTYDLELYLYSKILHNNMLHYGYFEDTSINCEAISFKVFEDAQRKYAENIIEHIVDMNNPILDVGCGTGGLSELIYHKNSYVESLTPNKNQIDFINKNLKHLKTHHCKFEQFKSNNKYKTVINSESLQYISLNEAFEKLDEIISSNGRWIVIDYFRLNDNGINKSGHILKRFRQKLHENNWNIIYERDITLNVLPTLSFTNMFVERLLLPIKHFAYEKLMYKKPRWYYMTRNLQKSIDSKIEKETAAINPDKFLKEKAYMFFVLEKTLPNKK